MTENDATLMTKSDMTVKIPQLELNKSRLDSQNGRRDTSQPAQDRKTTTTKSTEWKNGTTNYRLISPTTKITTTTMIQRKMDIKSWLTDMFVTF